MRKLQNLAFRGSHRLTFSSQHRQTEPATIWWQQHSNKISAGSNLCQSASSLGEWPKKNKKMLQGRRKTDDNQ